jgi:plasmid maintenance system antidote protein VapI
MSMRPKSGAALRELIRQDYSLASFAVAAGCSRSMIHGLCAGDKASCSDELASRIAEALSVSVDVLFAPSRSPIGGRIVTTVNGSVA